MELLALAELPYIKLPNLGPIQPFGVIVAVGVLYGAHLLRKYAEWHRVHDDYIRGLLTWVIVSGFAGAHIFDAVFYTWDKLAEDPFYIFKVWEGISSYGGFAGGAIGFFLYVWWKRLPLGLMADTTIVGLLPAFTIGRIGCSLVGDHLGAVTTSAWGQKWPVGKGFKTFHNLGFYEFLYLLPVCAIVLALAFRKSKRLNAGLLAILTGVLYAPVRFFLDYMRVDQAHDPRYLSLTFAQWMSIVAFAGSLVAAAFVLKKGRPVTPGVGEAKPDASNLLRDAQAPAKPAK